MTPPESVHPAHLARQENRPVAPRTAWRFDSVFLLIAALPWAIVRFDTSWLFGYAASPSGFIDPWVYFGFFLDLTQHIRAFKGAYFTTRLTWTVPGALIYHLFTPVVATYVLHLAVFYAATLSLYLILKVTVGQRPAMLATLLMAFHSYFLWSVGWPYMDGAANAYLLLTMCALTFAARSSQAKWWIFTAGALAAMTIYCQLFLIVFSPVVVGYYHFARRRLGTGSSLRPWRPFAWGFAAVTVAFGLFNMAINGRFLFFINSLGTAAKLVVNHNPYNVPIHHWLPEATWLVLPALALVGALICLRRKASLESVPNLEFVLFWERFYVLCVATMMFWQLTGQPVLQLLHYTSYLIPPAFLALGGQLAVVAHALKRAQLLVLCACIIFISMLPYALPLQSTLLLELRQHPFLFPLVLGIAAILMMASRIRPLPTLGVLTLCIALAALSATAGPRTWDVPTEVKDAAGQKSALLAIVDSVRLVQELDSKANLYFWYDGESHLGRLYRSVASTYLWAYRLQSESFPALGPKLPPPHRHILILAENGDVALRAAEASLHRSGLGAAFLAKHTIQQGPLHWDVMEIEVTTNTALPSETRP